MPNSATGCDCIVCQELTMWNSVTNIDDLATLMHIANELSPDVREIMTAQARVRKNIASDHEKKIVLEAASRCTAGALFHKVGELAVKVIH